MPISYKKYKIKFNYIASILFWKRFLYNIKWLRKYVKIKSFNLLIAIEFLKRWKNFRYICFFLSSWGLRIDMDPNHILAFNFAWLRFYQWEI